MSCVIEPYQQPNCLNEANVVGTSKRLVEPEKPPSEKESKFPKMRQYFDKQYQCMHKVLSSALES